MKFVARASLAALLTAALAGCSAEPAERAGSAYQRGALAFERGQPRTARIELLNALDLEPGNLRARLLRAEVELALGDGVAAESELARARQAGVPQAALAHLLAHSRLLQGDARGAIELAAGAMPEHTAHAARVRALALLVLGDPTGAAAEFDSAIAAAPDDPAVWTDIARFRRRNGDLAAAIAAADRALVAAPDHVGALILRGELTRGQYGLAAALPWFDRALEIDPANLTALLERAVTNGDLGRTRAMLADTRAVLAIEPDNALAFHLQATLAARAGKFDLARSLYNRTGGRLAETPAGMLLESAIDYRTGNFEQAARRLERLLAGQPENWKVRRLLAAAKWQQGDAPAVVAVLRPLADREDADSYTLSLIGRALERQGESTAAAHYLARAARPQHAAGAAVMRPVTDEELARLRTAAGRAGGDAGAQIRLISALLGRGLGEEALVRARRLQSANPGAPDAHVLVGDALGTRGDFAGAAEAYRRAANLAFTEPVALRLIEALQRSDRADAADGVLGLFLQQNPRNLPARRLLADRQMARGDWAAAIVLYEDLRRRLGDRDAVVLNNLAWAYAETGALAPALPLARQAWLLDRDNPATADTYGWILFKSGRRGEGLALLERAARGAPMDTEIRTRLAQARGT